ncbi:hypothetical protein [Glaciimonas immobilis]|uniref:Lrp/AsnC family transcriptional regulator n=1 Tax=Glaciimonas immobilis TaxID=728004 RepID=A0A840RVP7_9BURK|nr:hypothetical protein [Glaciimonas immobilis]KAF3996171.1 hypothetical protein HAV38_20765 [Glaciimonas immobilis]MBB5201673.1 hypothetical protein [Glaciimonas immobilis]
MNGFQDIDCFCLSLGRFDITAIVMSTSRAAILDIIETRIASLTGIHTIDVREQMASTKHRYDLVHIT